MIERAAMMLERHDESFRRIPTQTKKNSSVSEEESWG